MRAQTAGANLLNGRNVALATAWRADLSEKSRGTVIVVTPSGPMPRGMDMIYFTPKGSSGPFGRSTGIEQDD